MPARRNTKTAADDGEASFADRGRSTASIKTAVDGADLLPLYPTVAISDAVFSAVNFWAVQQLFPTNPLAALGFAIVGAAAGFGVLRFGFSPAIFKGVNEQLAATAAFVGLPLVGLSTIVSAAATKKSVLAAAIPAEKIPSVPTLLVALVIVHAIIRGLFDHRPNAAALYDILRVPFNLLLFIAPCAAQAFATATGAPDYQLLGGLVLIIVAGVGIRADRDSFLFGARRENLFHYFMAAATVLVTLGLLRSM